MPKDENKKTVRQKDAEELHATTTPDPASPPTIVEQSDPTKLKTTVTQLAKDRTITGNVGILDSFDARINPAKEDGNLASIKTNTDSLDITISALRDAIRGANTKDFSTIQTVLDSIKNTDGIKKITDTVTVTATDLDIRDLSKAQDEIYSVLKTDAGVAYDARDRNWTITESVPVTGTFWQVTQPVSATDLDIRDLSKAQDELYAVLRTDAGAVYDARDRSWTITETVPVSGTFWQVTQPVSGTLTVTDVSDIKTAVEKIDNQEDSIVYIKISKAAVDGDIIAAPGAGYFLRVHHLFVCNVDADWITFDVEDDRTPKFGFCLAARGGGMAQNLKRPWDLTENKALYYDYLTAGGAGISISITVGYETIAV